MQEAHKIVEDSILRTGRFIKDRQGKIVVKHKDYQQSGSRTRRY